MSPRLKLDEDVKLLLERIPYLNRLGTINKTAKFAQDEFTRGLKEMSDMEGVSLWLVLAAQCFLESHHVLRENVAMAQSQLWLQGFSIRHAVNRTFQYHENLKIENWSEKEDRFTRCFLIEGSISSS